MLKETLLTYVLPVLIWGGLTGIINLAFGYKSQIEAWAESHPRLAALLKFTRGIGLDPWHLLSALKLFAEKKLPDAQKSDSPIARAEQRKADAKRLGVDDLPPPPPTGAVPPLMLLMLCMALFLLSCSSSVDRPACTPTEHQKAKLAYQKDVHIACAEYDVLDECPHYLPKKAEFDRKISEGCR